jgi:Cys-tRNA(Pro)/Cys-tRNA(Cys) deacylase
MEVRLSVTPATASLDAIGVAYRLHSFRISARRSVREVDGYGTAAAAALGVTAARVYKTLVVTAEGRDDPAVVGVVPVEHRLDLRALAATVGAKRATLASPDEASRLTGYVVGGISPFGQRRHLPTIVDRSATDWPTMFCSAGRRGMELEIDPSDLVLALDARLAPIAVVHERRRSVNHRRG